MINNGITRRTRRWGSGAGLAGGAFVTAAMIGIGAAQAGWVTPADPLDDAVTYFTDANQVLFTSVDLLDDAVANFTDANQVLSGIDFSLNPTFEAFVNAQITTQDLVSGTIGILQHSEDVILSNAAPFGFLYGAIFAVHNLAWNLASEAVLYLDHALSDALESNSVVLATIANLGLYVADFGMFDLALDSFAINFLSFFF